MHPFQAIAQVTTTQIRNLWKATFTTRMVRTQPTSLTSWTHTCQGSFLAQQVKTHTEAILEGTQPLEALG